MPNIKTIISSMINSKPKQTLPPTKSINPVDTRQEPSAIAPYMNAGYIMSILTLAEGGQTRDLFALYRDVILADSHLQSEFGKRKLAVLGDTMNINPVDKNVSADVNAAQALRSAIASCPGWRMANAHLLNATLYPVAVLEKIFKPTPAGYTLANLIPVPYHLLDYTSGHLQIYDVDQTTGRILASKHDPDPNRYIIHRGHLLSMPDNWGGPMRSIMFWWLLSAMNREWWGRFIERYGSPFLLGKFSDDEGRSVLERAFALATRLGGLVVNEDTTVEIKQAAASDSGQAYERFLTICQREKSKLILGQTLSSEAQPTGLGDGTASIQENVRQDIRKLDATLLSETLHDQLFSQYCRINNLEGATPVIAWGGDSVEELNATLKLLGSLASAGLEVTDDAIPILSEKVGFGLQRRAMGLPIGASIPMSADNLAARLPIPRNKSATAAQIILDSRSEAEALSRLSVYCPELPSQTIQTLIREVIQF